MIQTPKADTELKIHFTLAKLHNPSNIRGSISFQSRVQMAPLLNIHMTFGKNQISKELWLNFMTCLLLVYELWSLVMLVLILQKS